MTSDHHVYATSDKAEERKKMTYIDIARRDCNSI